MTTDVETSYRICRQVAARSMSNFHWCFRLLPSEKRRAMYALYAFARQTDDRGDSRLPVASRRAALSEWRESLTRALLGEYRHDTMPALADTVRRYAIPEQYLFQLLDGVQLDLEPVGFETFEEVRDYCFLVASVVGLSCLHIWGFSQPAAIDLAIDRGIAFQLTNILRDIGEDAAAHRVYLPREDLRRFGCEGDLFPQDISDEALRALMRFEIERAKTYYRRSRGLARLIHPDGRLMLRLMTGTYWHLLERVRRRDVPVGGKPIRLGVLARLRIAHSALFPWGATRREMF
jgi:15-cis-phytoene synthase